VGPVAENADARFAYKILRIVTFVAVDTLGVREAEATKLLEELGRQMAEVTKEARSKPSSDNKWMWPSRKAMHFPSWTHSQATSPLDVSFT